MREETLKRVEQAKQKVGPRGLHATAQNAALAFTCSD